MHNLLVDKKVIKKPNLIVTAVRRGTLAAADVARSTTDYVTLKRRFSTNWSLAPFTEAAGFAFTRMCITVHCID